MLKTVNVDDIRESSHLNILAQRNDPNEVPISHGSDELVRKPDVVFMTEDELVGIHKVDRTASDWRSTLYTRCQIRLPTKTAQWRQFKAMFEFKRKPSKMSSLPVTFPTKFGSCLAGNRSFIRPQKLSESVTYVAEEPEEPAPEEPVPKACTFCPHSFLLQISTHSPPSWWQETEGTSDCGLWKDLKGSQDQHHTSHSSCCPQSQGAHGASGWICRGSHVRTDDDTHARVRH
jgi:hypothetical protein